MIADIKLEVVPVDGEPYLVSPALMTYVKAERRFKEPLSKLLLMPGIEVFAYLAYEQTRADGITVPASFDTWIESVADIRTDTGDDAAPLDATA